MRIIYFIVFTVIFFIKPLHSADLYHAISLFEDGDDENALAEFLEVYSNNTHNLIALAYLNYYKHNGDHQLKKKIPKTISFDVHSELGTFILHNFIQPGIAFRKLEKALQHKAKSLEKSSSTPKRKSKDKKSSKEDRKIKIEAENIKKLAFEGSMRANYLAYKFIQKEKEKFILSNAKEFDFSTLPDFGIFLPPKEILRVFLLLQKPLHKITLKALDYMALGHLFFAAVYWDSDALCALNAIPREELKLFLAFQEKRNSQYTPLFPYLLQILDQCNDGLQTHPKGLELDKYLLSAWRSIHKSLTNDHDILLGTLNPLDLCKKVVSLGDVATCELIMDTYRANSKKDLAFYYASIGSSRKQPDCSLEYAACLLEKNPLNHESRKILISLLKEDTPEIIKEKIYQNIAIYFRNIHDYISKDINIAYKKIISLKDDFLNEQSILEIQMLIEHSTKNTELYLGQVLFSYFMIFMTCGEDSYPNDSFYIKKSYEYGHLANQILKSYKLDYVLLELLYTFPDEFEFQGKTKETLAQEYLNSIILKTDHLLRTGSLDSVLETDDYTIIERVRALNLKQKFRLALQLLTQNENESEALHLIDELIKADYIDAFFLKVDYYLSKAPYYDIEEIVPLLKRGIDLSIEKKLSFDPSSCELLGLLLYFSGNWIEAEKYLLISNDSGGLKSKALLSFIQSLTSSFVNAPSTSSSMSKNFDDERDIPSGSVSPENSFTTSESDDSTHSTSSDEEMIRPEIHKELHEETSGSQKPTLELPTLPQETNPSINISSASFEGYDPEPWKKYRKKKEKTHKTLKIDPKFLKESKVDLIELQETETVDLHSSKKMERLIRKIQSKARPSTRDIKRWVGQLMNLFPEDSFLKQGNGSRAKCKVQGRLVCTHDQHNSRWGNKMEAGRLKTFQELFLDVLGLPDSNN